MYFLKKSIIFGSLLFGYTVMNCQDNTATFSAKHREFLQFMQAIFNDNGMTVSIDNLNTLFVECRENYNTEVSAESKRGCLPKDGGVRRSHYNCGDLLAVLEEMMFRKMYPERDELPIKIGYYKPKPDAFWEEMPDEALEVIAPYKIKQLEYEKAEQKIQLILRRQSAK